MLKYKTIFISLIISINIYAFSDIDMDGVADNEDKCPNTPISNLVDKNGCSTKVLYEEYHYDIVYGFNYANTAPLISQDLNIPSFSLRADLYYKNYYLQSYTAYYINTDKNGDIQNGFYDTYIGGGYQKHISDSIFISVGAGLLLPTYSDDLIDNKIDYQAQASISYIKDDMVAFGSYSYTIINDTNKLNSSISSNTTAYSLGAGRYFNKKTYVSLSYNFTNSIYKNIEDITTASLYTNYIINKHKYFMFIYSYGISKSANKNSVSILVGHRF